MNTKKPIDERNDAHEVMTLAEVAEYLKVSEKSVLRLARQGEIPVAKVASQWRFLRSTLDQWLRERMQAPAFPGGRSGEETELPLTRLFSPELAVLDLRPGSREEVLRQLIEPLVRTGRLDAPQELLRLLLRRELMVSTGVGHGVAFPHVRNPEECPVAEPCVVFGRCRQGTDFGAADEQPTRLFFLICCRSHVLHLRVLSELSILTRSESYRQRLEQIREPAALESLIAAFALERKAA